MLGINTQPTYPDLTNRSRAILDRFGLSYGDVRAVNVIRQHDWLVLLRHEPTQHCALYRFFFTTEISNADTAAQKGIAIEKIACSFAHYVIELDNPDVRLYVDFDDGGFAAGGGYIDFDKCFSFTSTGRLEPSGILEDVKTCMNMLNELERASQ